MCHRLMLLGAGYWDAKSYSWRCDDVHPLLALTHCARLCVGISHPIHNRSSKRSSSVGHRLRNQRQDQHNRNSRRLSIRNTLALSAPHLPCVVVAAALSTRARLHTQNWQRAKQLRVGDRARVTGERALRWGGRGAADQQAKTGHFGLARALHLARWNPLVNEPHQLPLTSAVFGCPPRPALRVQRAGGIRGGWRHINIFFGGHINGFSLRFGGCTNKTRETWST